MSEGQQTFARWHVPGPRNHKTISRVDLLKSETGYDGEPIKGEAAASGRTLAANPEQIRFLYTGVASQKGLTYFRLLVELVSFCLVAPFGARKQNPNPIADDILGATCGTKKKNCLLLR